MYPNRFLFFFLIASSVIYSPVNSVLEQEAKKARRGDSEAACSCGWHALCNHERVLMLNDNGRSDAYMYALQRTRDALVSGHDDAESIAGDLIFLGFPPLCLYLCLCLFSRMK